MYEMHNIKSRCIFSKAKMDMLILQCKITNWKCIGVQEKSCASAIIEEKQTAIQMIKHTKNHWLGMCKETT